MIPAGDFLKIYPLCIQKKNRPACLNRLCKTNTCMYERVSLQCTSGIINYWCLLSCWSGGMQARGACCSPYLGHLPTHTLLQKNSKHDWHEATTWHTGKMYKAREVEPFVPECNLSIYLLPWESPTYFTDYSSASPNGHSHLDGAFRCSSLVRPSLRLCE